MNEPDDVTLRPGGAEEDATVDQARAETSEPRADAGVDAAAPSADERVDGLGDRLRSIEEQPLPERAAAFARVHDELRTRLETGGSPSA